MLGAKRLFVDRQRPLVERLGLGVAALGVVQQREVVEDGAHDLVVGPNFYSTSASNRFAISVASAYLP
jgi:hypothetical protein